MERIDTLFNICVALFMLNLVMIVMIYRLRDRIERLENVRNSSK